MTGNICVYVLAKHNAYSNLKRNTQGTALVVPIQISSTQHRSVLSFRTLPSSQLEQSYTGYEVRLIACQLVQC